MVCVATLPPVLPCATSYRPSVLATCCNENFSQQLNRSVDLVTADSFGLTTAFYEGIMPVTCEIEGKSVRLGSTPIGPTISVPHR